MRRQFLLCSIAVAMAAPAAAAPWSRGFVVDNYEPAFYYGAKLGGTEAPGSDCPKGTNPDNDYRAILTTKWRSPAQVSEVLHPSNPSRSAAEFLAYELAYRGFRKDIDTYLNPFAAPDPGMQEVTGTIAEGFNLDGNANTGGFSSPTGEKGIDNAFYRAFGCIMSYRGTPYHAYLSQRANDKMLDGLYTMVVRISGNKDPMNDDDAVVEVGYSPDHVVKGGDGKVLPDFSFRPAKGEQYTRLKAKVKNGVVETEQVANLRVPEFAYYETMRGEANYQNGKMRLTINKDRSVSGLLGGYRDWRDVYNMDTFGAGGGGSTRETYYHEDQIAMYYALKRNADGLPDPKTGQNMGISASWRFTGQAAYVVDPATPVVINEPGSHRADKIRALFKQATITKAIAPGAKRKPDDYDGLLEKPAAPKPQPGLQVNNGATTTVAAATR